jgi:hypothetical protein
LPPGVLERRGLASVVPTSLLPFGAGLRTVPETNIAPLPTYSDTPRTCAVAYAGHRMSRRDRCLGPSACRRCPGLRYATNHERRSHDVPRVRWGGRGAVRASRLGLGRRDLCVSALPGARDRSPGLCVAPSACQGGCRPRPAHCKRPRDRGCALSFPRAGEAQRVFQAVSLEMPMPLTAARRRFASLGALLVLAATVCACDLSPQPLPPAGAQALPRAGSGSSATGGPSEDAASSADGGLPGLGSGGSSSGSSSAGGSSGAGPMGSPPADGGGQDATAGLATGSEAGRGEAGGEAGSGDSAAADGAASPDGGGTDGGGTDGGMPPDGGGTDGGGADAGCDSGCSREGATVYCSASKVDWVCSGNFDQSAMESACGPALGTDAIRYCCPADFRRQCP